MTHKTIKYFFGILLLSLVGCSTITNSFPSFNDKKDLNEYLEEGWSFYVLKGKLLLIKQTEDHIEVRDYFDTISHD
jgi:hypothetical protein